MIRRFVIIMTVTVVLAVGSARADEVIHAQQDIATSPTGSKPEGEQQTHPGEENKAVSPGSPPQPEQPSHPSEIVDLLHGELSRQLAVTAVWFDSYFGDERAVIEQNQSYMRIRYDAFQEERQKILLKPSIDMRLSLPQLEKKTHLVFSAEPSTPVTGTGTPVTPAGERIPQYEQNVSAALHYLFRSTAQESFIVRAGLQVNKWPPVLFIAPRYRSTMPVGPWTFRFTQEAPYRTDKGWASDTLLDLERPLPHDFFFRTSVEGNWYAYMKGYFYSLGFSLREVFDPVNALDYECINYYRTRPENELAEVDFRIRYRHSFWREWLFYEIAPQVRFPRDHNFNIVPGILFRLEVYFGRVAGQPSPGSFQ